MCHMKEELRGLEGGRGAGTQLQIIMFQEFSLSSLVNRKKPTQQCKLNTNINMIGKYKSTTHKRLL